MITREFADHDQSAVIELQEAFMREFFPEYVDDPRQYEWNADVYDIDRFYLKRGGKIWVTEVDGYIAGFGGFRLVDPTTAEIKRVRIASDYRGQGFGKSIIEKIENHCKEASIDKILVGTDDRFEAAKAMYVKMDYQLYRTETETRNGIEYKDNFYQKLL